MRLEQHDTNRFNKFPDVVESKLIRIINTYFKDLKEQKDGKNNLILNAIVNEAVDRVKNEIYIKHKALGISGKHFTSADIGINCTNAFNITKYASKIMFNQITVSTATTTFAVAVPCDVNQGSISISSQVFSENGNVYVNVHNKGNSPITASLETITFSAIGGRDTIDE